MQTDFHYYCVAVLAKAAGFNEKDALTIAYASQYVDHSTESEPIRVGEMMFDPLRTAHYGLRSYEWSVQKRVFIPFHFLPPKSIRSPEDTFITRPNSRLANMILDEAFKEQGNAFRLIRIGVALHTFADTWAHRKFSGRHHNENDVGEIQHSRNGGGWRTLLMENAYLDFLPRIGHAEAGHFPDQPFLKWRYKRKLTNRFVPRDNTGEFMKAAKKIYDRLNQAPGAIDSAMPWVEIGPKIEKLFEYDDKDEKKRCNRWKLKFKRMFDPLKYDYDKREWRNDALEPSDEVDTDWDDYRPVDFQTLSFNMKPGFYDSPWVLFHRAAMKQRHFVLEKLL